MYKNKLYFFSYIFVGDILRRIKVFLWNGIFLTITSLIMRMVLFSFNVYISNQIGTEAIGVFSLIMSVYMFSITVATSGINLATTRIVVEEIAKNPECGNKYLLRKCLKYSFTLGSIAGLLLILFSPWIAKVVIHNKVSSYLFIIIAISLPCISMSASINGYFSGIRKDTKNAITRIFEQFVKIIITIYFLNTFLPRNLENACLALIMGETISEIASFLFAYFLYRLEKRKYNYHAKGKNYQKRITRIAMPVAITSYIRSGLSSIKQTLIPLRLEKFGLSCQDSLSKYGLINGMAMQVLMFPEVFINSFSLLLIPEFSYYHTQNLKQRISQTISKIFQVTLLFAIGVIGVFWTYAEEISIAIYNNIEVSIYIRILCPLLLFMYLDGIIDSILKGLDKQVSVMKCNILDLFISIFCIYFFVPIYGVKGYLGIIFMSELLNSGISLWQLKRETKFKIDILEWILKPMIGVLLAKIISKMVPIYGLSENAKLIIEISIFCIIYLIYICIMKKRNCFATR